MSDISIRVVTELTELEALAGVWDYLAQESGDDSSIFLTYERVSTWWRHFGGKNKLNILVLEKEGEPVGIIPLMKSRYSIGPFAFNVLETVGAINDNRVGLISAESREEVIATFLTYLQNELTGQPLIARLELVPDDSQFIRVLREKRSLFADHLLMDEGTISLAPYVPLPQSWEEYFASLGWRRRKVLRQALRHLEQAHTVEYKQFSQDSIEGGLAALFDLHQRRWQSVNIRSPFSDRKTREFYRDLTPRLLAKNRLHFSCLSVDGEVASVLYAYVHEKRFLLATSARDLKYSKYSVGHLHEMYAIKEAIAKHLGEYDFLRGDEPYKFYWTDKFRRYLRLTIISNKSCALLRLKFMIAFLRLSEIIRHKHSLKELYSLYKLERIERREKKAMGLLHKLG